MTRVAESPGTRRGDDDHERFGGRLVDGLVEQVDQHRHREHRAAAAGETDRDADARARGERDQHP